jgi:competence protein ComEC
MRRLAAIHLLLGGYVAGLCLALVWRPAGAGLIVAGLAAAAAAAAAAGLHRRRPAEAICLGCAGLIVALAAAGAAVGGARVDVLAQSQARPLVGTGATVDAVVLDLPKASGSRLSVPVRVVAVNGRPLLDKALLQLETSKGGGTAKGGAAKGAVVQQPPAELLDPTGPFIEGARIHLPGARIQPLPPPSADGFDYGRYLRRRGIHVVLAATLADLQFTGRRGGLSGVMDRLRVAARGALARGVRSPVREVLRGMVLGDAENVDAQAIDDFRRSGLLHIMAVSGENVVLLCTLLGAALSALALGRRLRLFLMLPMIATYVVITGASPSIVRAGVAGALVTIAGLTSRPADLPLMVLAPAAVLLTMNPWNLLDVGFQLSFAAGIGLFLLAGHVVRLLHFLPRSLAETAGVTAAASVATAPISLASFGQASLIGVVANVAGGFVLGPVMFCGMLSVLVGLAWPAASLPLNVAAGTLIAFLLSVARFCAHLPLAVYQWQGLSVGFVVAAGGLALLLTAQVLSARLGVGVLRFVFSPRRRQAAVLAVATLVALALVTAPSPPRAPSVPTLTVLSVGEGAAALVQSPSGLTTLIDAGPSPLARTLRAHGVRAIDLLVLSHGHADHTAGLADVLQTFTVRTALLPRPPTPDTALDRLQKELEACGARVLRCAAPLTAACGGYTVSVLPTSGGEGGEDANQAQNDWALVAEVSLGDGAGGAEHEAKQGEQSGAGSDGQNGSQGVAATATQGAEDTVLLPGDAEGEALGEVVGGPVAAVELPHHGSAGGLDTALLSRLNPRMAMISVGPNRYGHPTAEMLALMASAGVPCLRTDKAGDITFSASPSGLRVAVSQQ